MRTAWFWLPIFGFVILVCSYFDKFRFFLYTTVVAATYGTILNIMKKKNSEITFDKEQVIIGSKCFNISEIEHYYICLPLNELFMLRLKTSKGKQILYIGKECKEEIEEIMIKYKKPLVKTANDTYLKYSHGVLIIIGLLMTLFVFVLYERLKYKF